MCYTGINTVTIPRYPTAVIFHFTRIFSKDRNIKWNISDSYVNKYNLVKIYICITKGYLFYYCYIMGVYQLFLTADSKYFTVVKYLWF